MNERRNMGAPPRQASAWRHRKRRVLTFTTLLSLSAVTAVTSIGASFRSADAQTTPVVGAPTRVPLTSKIACVSITSIRALPLEWQAAHVVMVGVPVTKRAVAKRLVAEQGVGGILVRGVPRLTDGPALIALRDARVDVPTILAVDEEGGRVQHLRGTVGRLPSPLSMAKTKSPSQVRAMIAKHARGMKALGFTMNFGPVADLYNTKPNGIGDRAFSADPNVAAEYTTAFAHGMLDGGITPVLKHFPGHGNAGGDPHYQGTVGPTAPMLRSADVVPFQRTFAALPVGVMTSHQVVPDLESIPASVSARTVTDLLRAELGFNGPVVTDSLSMWAIRYHWSAPQAAERALRAGNDILLFDDLPDVSSITKALIAAATAEPKMATRLAEANVRILLAKGIPLCIGATPPVLPPTGIAATSPAPVLSSTTIPALAQK